MPDFPLWNDQNDEVGHKINPRAGGKHNAGIKAACSRDGLIPYSLVRCTGQVAGYDDGRVVEDVENHDSAANPDEAVSCMDAGDGSRRGEDSNPFKENGHFYRHHHGLEEKGADVNDLVDIVDS